MPQYVAEIELQFDEVTQDTDSFHINVQVVGADGGRIDGAAVSITGDVEKTEETTDGTASFTVPQAGNYTVEAVKDGETTSGTIYESTFQQVE